jgi:hypothetical protein
VTGGALLLPAAVPATEAAAALGRALGVRSLADGPIAAIVGPARREGSTRTALRHARIVARALEGCTSVVPFRLGVEFSSDQDVQDLLAENLAELCGRLGEVAGRVEMGLKVRIPLAADDRRLDEALGRVRALAPGPGQRLERRKPVAGAVVLVGCYLVARGRIDEFWTAVSELRSASGMRVLGTGPWAPYSFCELSLRPASKAPPGAPPPDRRLS